MKKPLPEQQQILLQRIREELRAETPDIYGRLLPSLSRRAPESPVEKARRFPRALAAAAAACLLLFAGVFGGLQIARRWPVSLSGAVPQPASDSAYLFTVHTRPAYSDVDGDVVVSPGDTAPLLSNAGSGDFERITSWAYDGSGGYRLDIDLWFSFLGEGIESISYASTQGAFLEKRGLLSIGEDSMAEAVNALADLSDNITLERGDSAPYAMWLAAEAHDVPHRREYDIQRDSSRLLALRLRVPVELVDADSVSAMETQFRTLVESTRLTATLRYHDGRQATAVLGLGLDGEDPTVITVTLNPTR